VRSAGLLATAAADRLHAAWLLALQCGLRRSEICALRWDDVDLPGGTVTIHRARVVVDGKVIDKDTPKSDASARTIPLPPAVTAALSALHKRQAAERLAAGQAYAAGYVVTDELGAPPNPERLSDEWERLVRKAGVSRLTIHGARHNANSVAADLGIPPHDRAAYFGHTVAVNEGTYTHPSAAGLGRVADAMSGAFEIAGG
jgi:integrase